MIDEEPKAATKRSFPWLPFILVFVAYTTFAVIWPFDDHIKPQPDANLRDTENVTLSEDIRAGLKDELLNQARLYEMLRQQAKGDGKV